MAPRELVRDAVERVVISGHDSTSGAGLGRVRLGVGRAIIVNRIRPDEDTTMRVRDPGSGSEHRLSSSGVPDRLPDRVSQAVIWPGGDTQLEQPRPGDPCLRARRPSPSWISSGGLHALNRFDDRSP